MAHEGRVNTAVAVELFFEGKDHERFVDIVADEPHPPLPPRPELRRNVVDGGNAALFHLPRHTPVEGRRVDDDGEVGAAAVGFADQAPKKSPDFRQMAENFRDANDGQVFGVDDSVASGGAHATPANAEEGE